ncbi:MAG TPA: sugar MFS transporter [Candidatus Acidoferrales bacterium]|nr:sugar MFS transporter [Candidatus Acidoferrales bacterium]
MTTLFFMWGFMTVLNDILIPRFREAFALDYFHAMLVQGAFFGAYFVGSLIYFIISANAGDPIAKIGYKNGVVIGLLLSALSCGLFWPAATQAPRASMIVASDVKNIPALSQQLAHPTNAVATFVASQLSDATRQLLNANSAGLTPALAGDLNQLINGPVIYDTNRFAGVSLSDTTKELVAKNPEGVGLVLLNRTLLEDAFPGEVTKNFMPYWFFLMAYFILGLGFAMLQIAANPYVTILGPERTASSRLNLAQAFNSIGTTVGPLIGGFLIFYYFAKTGAHGTDSVKVPFLGFCVLFLLLAGIFFVIRLPHVGEGKVEPGAGALKYPHVLLGILAIFMYVGGEVSIGSAIINFLGQKSVAGMAAVEASKYVSIYWGGLMIGRFMAAVELSEMKKLNKQIMLVFIPLLAYLLLWVAKSAPLDALYGNASQPVMTLWKNAFVDNWQVFKYYLPFVGLCWLLFQFGQAKAGRTLLIFSLTVVGLLLTAIMVGGYVAMWCIVGIGLFTSIGWPNIFSLALDGTGVYKSQVSSLLVMAILGGAILPPLQGWIADTTHNLQISFIVPLIAYAYVAFYGAIGHKIGRKNLPN